MKISELTQKQQERIIQIMDRSIVRIENTKQIFLENMLGNYTHHELTDMLKAELKHLLRYQTYSSRDNQEQEDLELINNL